MLLDIYVTHWTEEWHIGEKGFLMMKLQRDVDWKDIRVTLVHDGTQKFSDATFAGYPFEVRQVELEHRGIAGVRNWCLDDSRADWIKFNDFDDCFSNIYALRSILQGLDKAGKIDLLWFHLYAEMNGRVFVKDDRNPVVLHNKVFRRSFLNNHHIRFNEELTWCEDSAFLALVEMEINHERIGRIVTDVPPYVWFYREGSLSNRREILYENRMSFYRRHRYVQDEMRKHGQTEPGDAMTARIMADSYATIFLYGLDEDMGPFEKEVWEYFLENRYSFLRIPKRQFDEILEASNKENECNITRGELVNWIRGMRLKYGEAGERVHG